MKTLLRYYASTLLLPWLLLSAGDAWGWQVLLLAGDACPPQWDFRAFVPYEIDPNEPNSPTAPVYARAAILPPVPADQFDPDDPEQWLRPIGKWVRTAACCVPGGWLVHEIRQIGGAERASITWDTAAGTWTMTTEVRPGAGWCAVEATSAYGVQPDVRNSRVVFVTWYGVRPEGDHAPILAWIGRWLEVG
jgi:hypothetical protein